MFGHELVDLLYFELGEGEQSPWKGMGRIRKEFNSVVPNRMAWEPLGLFFAKDFGMTSIVSGDLLMVWVFIRWV